MKTIEPKIARYQKLKFHSNKAFDNWLENKTAIIIEFVDDYQDLLKIWVDEKGEILNGNLQNGIWLGKFVNVEQLGPEKPIKMWDQETEQWDVMQRLVIESVTTL